MKPFLRSPPQEPTATPALLSSENSPRIDFMVSWVPNIFHSRMEVIPPVLVAIHCRANMAHTRQSRPDSGLSFQVNTFEIIRAVHSSLGRGKRSCVKAFPLRSRTGGVGASARILPAGAWFAAHAFRSQSTPSRPHFLRTENLH